MLRAGLGGLQGQLKIGCTLSVGNGKEVAFRAAAAFAKPEIYEALEEQGVKYAIRIPANENLERDIADLLNVR